VQNLDVFDFRVQASIQCWRYLFHGRVDKWCVQERKLQCKIMNVQREYPLNRFAVGRNRVAESCATL
jgi:hypothetical protein